ncbi:MAG TPA: PGPGW domain-containing protein [Propionibacteriaceae bacterium]|nr:PGPGW domain-containing protein [Propionibacteriaceae bacterium]
MSSGVEGSDAVDADRLTATMPRRRTERERTAHRELAEAQRELAEAEAQLAAARRDRDTHHSQHDHHVLVDPEEDRWRWRRKIRQDPRKLAVYRVVVGIAGLLMICLGFISGPIPGPGGIPLVLLGLAIWSSEFKWAHRLMLVFKVQLRRFQTWSRRKQVLFWAAFVATCGLLGFTFMLITGIPGWVPPPLELLLQRLPGL